MNNKITKEFDATDFHIGRIYQHLLSKRDNKVDAVKTRWGIAENLDVIRLVRTLQKIVPKAEFTLKPIEYGWELIIEMTKEKE